MKRNMLAKRILSFALAAILVCACILSTRAGCETSPYTAESEGMLTVTSNGGRYTYQIGTAKAKSNTGTTQITPPLGTVVKLNATDSSIRQFMYWKDEYSSRVYSYERALEVVIGSDIYLRAVYAVKSTTSHFVSVVNYGNTLVVDGREVANGEYLVPPQGSKVPGMTFKGWSETSESIRAASEPLIVYPRYTVNAETFTVEITNDAYVTGAGTYNNFQTVSLSAEPKNGEGETFSYWQNADGEIVSYERNYSFRINYNTVLTAVYGEEVTPEPIVRTSLIYRDPDDAKITFYAERSVPEGYTVVAHGILMSTAQDVTQHQMTVFNAGYSANSAIHKCTGNSNESCGTFSLAKGNITHDIVVSARPYVITKDEAGNQFLTYGDMVQASNAEAVTDTPLD